MRILSPLSVVYIIGVVTFGLSYQQLKLTLGGGAVFFAAAVAYLLFLRVLGWLVVRILDMRKE